MGQFTLRPPGIQRHHDGARQQPGHEHDRPLRQVAHHQRHPVALAKAARAHRSRQVQHRAAKFVVGDTFAAQHQELAPAPEARRGERLGRGRGRMLPHPHGRAAAHRSGVRGRGGSAAGV